MPRESRRRIDRSSKQVESKEKKNRRSRRRRDKRSALPRRKRGLPRCKRGWEADILPLNYSRIQCAHIYPSPGRLSIVFLFEPPKG